ncbi:MAG: hypothetical protein GC201_02995 [Alphaproteobacteria bacterium]|nr:hypothetical protein [Alphaproteobacteria bacterium]
MDVQLAEERILVFNDQFTMDHAEGRAATRRIEAFGTMARVAGLLSKPKENEFELVYRERRLQPFWHVSCSAVFAYERHREHEIRLAPEVREVLLFGETLAPSDQHVTVPVLERCREEFRRDLTFDALNGQLAHDLASRLSHDSLVFTQDELAGVAKEGTVVVPPQATSSVIVRQVLAGLMNKIEADKVIEETVVFDAVDLCYRPVYAFRYRRQNKEAVVEFDGLTGEVSTGGSTFETYLGKIMDTKFLLDAGAEAVDLIIPGANLMRVIVGKGVEMRKNR